MFRPVDYNSQGNMYDYDIHKESSWGVLDTALLLFPIVGWIILYFLHSNNSNTTLDPDRVSKKAPQEVTEKVIKTVTSPTQKARAAKKAEAAEKAKVAEKVIQTVASPAKKAKANKKGLRGAAKMYDKSVAQSEQEAEETNKKRLQDAIKMYDKSAIQSEQEIKQAAQSAKVKEVKEVKAAEKPITASSEKSIKDLITLAKIRTTAQRNEAGAREAIRELLSRKLTIQEHSDVDVRIEAFNRAFKTDLLK